MTKRVSAPAALLLALAGAAPVMALAQPQDISEVSIEDLLNVEITTASRTPSRLESAPGIVTVISRQDILNMGARTLGDVLNTVPGFTVGRALQGGFHSSLYVRGAFSFNSENVLFLLDGRRLNDGITGGGLSFVPDYPVDNVHQVEIIRGPGSALYGANAFVGVVNIVTLAGHAPKGGRVSYRAGSLDGHYATAEYVGRAGRKLDYTVHGSFTNFDDPDLPQRDIQRLIVPARVPGFNQTFTGRSNSEAVRMFNTGGSLKYGGLAVTAGFDTSDDSNNWIGGARRRDDAYRNRFETENVRVGSTFSHAFSPKVSLELSAGFQSHDSTSKYIWENVSPVSGEVPISDEIAGGNFNLEDWHTQTIDAEALWTFQPASGHTLVAGAAYQRDSVREVHGVSDIHDTNRDGFFDRLSTNPLRTVTRVPRDVRRVYAGFAQYAWAASSWLTLTGGVRGDDYSDFGSTVNPRFAMVLSPTSKLSLKALAARAFRAPALQELRRSVVGALVPNRNLKPERIATYELQVNYRLLPALSLSASGFLYDIDDVIRQVANNPRNPLVTTWRNLGTRRSKGLELEMHYQPRRTLSAFANFSLVRSTDTANAVTVPVAGIPRRSLNFGVSADPVRRLTLAVGGSARWSWTPQPPIPMTIPNLPPVQLFGELTFPGYFAVNTRVAVHDVLPRTSLTFDVFNVFDDEQFFPEQHSFVPGGISANGRQFLVGAQVRF